MLIIVFIIFEDFFRIRPNEIIVTIIASNAIKNMQTMRNSDGTGMDINKNYDRCYLKHPSEVGQIQKWISLTCRF